MNIKNERAHQLARQVAAATGESVTTAVTVALEERWARLQKRGSLSERLLAIGQECAAHLKEPWRSADHGDLLYDERGLPK
ncbi:MAG: type II toxin-antitoxin system VapB family antitoxin [Terriglobales bacterium]|jgi:antitoxin VapB